MTQIEYLEILFNDVGFDRLQRNGYLSRIFNRTIKYLDELSVTEKSYIIDQLKKRKEENARAKTTNSEGIS